MHHTSAAPPLSIIAHSHLRWDFVWQRPQHVLSRLAEHYPVLFVEEAQIAPGPAQLRIVPTDCNVVRAIPVMPEPCAVDRHCELLLPQLQRALLTQPLLAGRFEHPVQWFYSPMCAPALAGAFGEAALVYDCMDELANFRFAPSDIAAREKRLLAEADLVFTGGQALFEAKSRLHPNVHFFGCGVDVAHFSQARHPDTVPPPAVAGLPRPVLGYFGVIDERLDYELIAALADAFAGGSVVMAGPVAKVDPSELPRRDNIHWLGQQPYADLPALVKGFDVCLMPFALNEATRYINPTKTLEYLAAGKPVVSTAIGDVARNFADVVRVAGSPAAFIEAVRQATREADAARIAAGLARAAGSTWEGTVEAMRQLLLRAVRSRLSLAAA